MSFFDFLKPKQPDNTFGFSKASGQPDEKIFAVPVLGRKFTTTGVVPKETYLFYVYLYDESPEAAVARARKEVRTEGFEFLEQAGKVLVTNVGEWSRFLETHFDWIKDDLPTQAEIRDGARGLIYYSPKIERK
jgi:hypothetical protein